VQLTGGLPLRDLLPHVARWSHHDDVPHLDDLVGASGFVLYRRQLDLAIEKVLTVEEVRDRALVFLDDRPVGVLEREHHARALTLPATGQAILDVLVEDQGRVDYGPRIGERKGLIGPVTLDGEALTGNWSAATLHFDKAFLPDAAALNALHGTPLPRRPTLAGPVVAVGSLVLQRTRDVHLALDGFGKGVVWVNGFCLGRYWSRGPQRTLYVPAPILREGHNDIVVLELHGALSRTILVLDQPDFGPTDAI
jgi:beta-galactosidase